MKAEKPFNYRARLKSFRYAFNGLGVLFREEHNSRVHLVAAVAVIVLSFALGIAAVEWIAMIVVIALVFITEIINTTIENLADFVSPAHHEKIRRIKDLSAAGVLISAVAALITGLIVFVPKIIAFTEGMLP